MKNSIPKILQLFTLVISNLLSFGSEIKLFLNEKNEAFFYRENESFELKNKNHYELYISYNERIKFVLQNNSQKKPVLKFITKRRDLEFKANDFKLLNYIETDENQILNYQGKSCPLSEGEFEVVLTTEGDTIPKFIFLSIRYKEKDSNNSVGGNIPIQPKTQSKDANHEENNTRFVPGCAVTDAIALNTKKALTYQELLQLFSHYFPGANNQSDIIAAAKNNVFLESVVDEQLFADAIPESGTKSQNEGGSLLSNLSFSSIGGLDVTNIADGFAKFLVKRTKEELSIAFFEKLKKDLKNPQFKDIQTLFPKTYSLLLIVGEDIYSYQRYIQNIREAFKGDINDLVKNLPSVIQNHPDFFKRNKELVAALNSACYVANELQNHTHPGDILANYPVANLKEFPTQYPAAAIRTLQLINMSMRKVSAENNLDDYWVDINQVRNMANDRKTFKIYLGLLLQETKNKFGDISYSADSNHSLVSILNKIAEIHDTTYIDYESYKQYILQFAQKTQALNSIIRSNKGLSLNNSASFELYAKYFSSTVDLIEYATKASELPCIKDSLIGSLHDRLKPYFEITYKTADLSIDINRRNYSSAINNAVNIYDLIKSRKEIQELEVKIYHTITKIEFKKRKTENDTNVLKLKDLKAKGTLTNEEETQCLDLDKALCDFNEKAKDYYNKEINENKLDSLNLIIQKLAKYGAFFSTVAQAKNSDDVEKAIEAAALPSGSSRIKRETPFNVSLNAYTGLFVGHEKITGVDDSHWFKSNAYGLTAPIGIAVSIGKRKCSPMFWKQDGNWSYSLFVSLVDIGAVAAFRFQNTDSIAQVPTIKLKDLFSPGLFISVGIPKCPLSVNLGAQVGPNLRNVNIEDKANPGKYINGYQENVYWRFSASIVVDLPLLNFYTKSK